MVDLSSWLYCGVEVCTLCTMCTLVVAGTQRKVRTGVSFDGDVAETLAKHTDSLKGSRVTRSEVVNAILADFLEGMGTTETVWEVVTNRRIRRRV